MRIAVHIHNHLFLEIRIVPLAIQSQFFSKQRDVKRKVHTCIPSLFLIQIGSYIHFAATGQEEIVFGQHICRPKSFSCRKTHMKPVERIIFYVQAGCHKEVVQRAVICPQSCQKDKLVIQIVCILRISPGNNFGAVVRCPHAVERQVFVKAVVVQTQARAQAMRRREFLFVEQTGVHIVLVHIVKRPVIHGSLLVIRTGKDQRHTFHLFLVDYIGLFSEQLCAVRLQAHAVGIGKVVMHRSLSARTVLVQIAHAILGDIVIQLMIPAVH